MAVEESLFGKSESKEAFVNIQHMFDNLFYSVTYDRVLKSLELKYPSEEVQKRTISLIKNHLDTTSDALIQILSQVLKNKD